MRWLLILALLAGCAGSSPPPLGQVPDGLRACAGSVLLPAPLSGVVSLSRLKAQEQAEALALQRSEVLRLRCALKLANLVAWIEEQRRSIEAAQSGRGK